MRKAITNMNLFLHLFPGSLGELQGREWAISIYLLALPNMYFSCFSSWFPQLFRDGRCPLLQAIPKFPSYPPIPFWKQLGGRL
jgi:hypothetical protein